KIIEYDPPTLRIIHTQQQLGDRGLAAARPANDRNFFTLPDLKFVILQGLYPCVMVYKIYIFKTDITLKMKLCGSWRLLYSGSSIQKFVDPLLRSCGTLNHAGRKSNGAHRKCEHVYIHHKLHDGMQADIMGSIDI